MTACVTSCPRYASASAFSFCSTYAEISCGVNSSSPIFCFQSVPISLFTDIIVRSGLVTACLFAVIPTRRSPSLVKATTEGVVLLPSELGITVALPPSRVATQLFVVPRSIPITALLISFTPLRFYSLSSAVVASELMSNLTSRIPLFRSHSTILSAE